MHIETSFWTKEAVRFEELLFVCYKSTECEPTILHRGSCVSKNSLSSFFKQCEDWQNTREAAIDCLADPDDKDGTFTQFAVIKDGEITPIIWFSIVTDYAVYTHDYAFRTTLIKKNGVKLPFGKFFPKKVKTKYRALKIKKTAYRYLSNQLKGL